METPRSGFSMVLIFAGTHGKGCAVAMAPPRPVLSPRVPRLAAGAVVPIVAWTPRKHRCAEAASGGTRLSFL